MWLKARIRHYRRSAPGPKTTLGPIVTSRPTAVSWLNQTVRVDQGRAAGHRAAAPPRCMPQAFGHGQVGAVVDAQQLVLIGLDNGAFQAVPRASATMSVR